MEKSDSIDDYHCMLNYQRKADKEIIEYIKKSFSLVDPTGGILNGYNDFFIIPSRINHKLKESLYKYDRLENRCIKISKDFDFIYRDGLLFNKCDYFIAVNQSSLKDKTIDSVLYKYDKTTNKCNKITTKPSYNILDYISDYIMY